MILFWVEQGVKTFRVDNPHTKPTVFWEWLIADVQQTHPEVIFLSEAFTRPKVMKSLAKAGFTQSYTYFTWRNFKAELEEYFTELTQSEMKEYYRGNLFPNTHDILPFILQEGGRPAFKMRFALAATLSSVYGIYSSYELCENTPVPGREEYLNSEKYEYKVWDWDRPGNIIPYITRINAIRREHPALHLYDNLRFYPSDDENITAYGKATPDGSDRVLVVVNLDPFDAHETWLHLPLAEWGSGTRGTVPGRRSPHRRNAPLARAPAHPPRSARRAGASLRRAPHPARELRRGVWVGSSEGDGVIAPFGRGDRVVGW